MKPATLAAILCACTLATPTLASAATLTYGSIGITAGSDVDQRFGTARDACMIEAQTPLRGHPRIDNFYYKTALRACLYRNGFSSDGAYAYPVPLFGSPGRQR